MWAQGVQGGPGAHDPPEGTRRSPTWISCRHSRPLEPFLARKLLGPGVALPRAQPQGTELMAQAGVQTPVWMRPGMAGPWDGCPGMSWAPRPWSRASSACSRGKAEAREGSTAWVELP